MDTSVPYAIDLWNAQTADIGSVGGKGANLAELVRAGLPVPRAFCVTTHAYKAFVAKHRLQEVISHELADLVPDDVFDLAARSGRIRSKFLDADMPKDIEADIRGFYETLARAAGWRTCFGAFIGNRRRLAGSELRGSTGYLPSYMRVRTRP
jgi:pyruvate,water dikinase